MSDPAGAASGSKSLEAIWTRLVIDPPADRLVRPLARLPWVTPNRITLAAGLLALASAAAFVTGQLVLGAVLFQLRFLVDCLDGRLARIRGTATVWGASFDLAVDVVGISLNYAALASYLVGAGDADPLLLAGIVTANGLYLWTLAHRKSLPGGGQHDWIATGSRQAELGSNASLWGRYVARMARWGMVPTPYAVEVEALALTLLPLGAALAGVSWPVVWGLWLATAFYVVASLLNIYRTWRLASALDRERADSRERIDREPEA